ncbi:Kelch repeat-containing protein 3 [Xanthoria parietina]
MGKKEKKSKTAEQKARVAAKQVKKATQKEKKGKTKDVADSDAEDVDLDAIRAEYERQQAQFLKITESSCEPPSARASATLIGSPTSRELFLFGGEYYNGALASFYNDLFVYLIDKDEWRKVTSPNSPLPRSGHAWSRSTAGDIYLFGGEFSSPKQGTFYHYNDFWKLDPSSREWTRIESKKGPPARSGHRMTFFKGYIVLFGGFQDTSQQTKYLHDIWLYDTHNYMWYNPVLPPATQKPDPRSSFSMHPHNAGAIVYGGYSRVKATASAGKTKGGGQALRSVLKPVVHVDAWFLRITQPPTDAAPNTPPTLRWERRKKPVNSPLPSRAGATQVYHKGRGIAFGGVHDVEESEEGMESEFFDSLLAWNIERNRFFQLTLRRPRAAGKRQVDDRSNRKGKGRLDEEELLRNLATLEAKGRLETVDTISEKVQDDSDTAVTKPMKQPLFTLPHPRFNAQLAVQDDVLYIFGGTFEHGDREYTFDEMWAIDLGKLDGVQEIYKRELDNWQGSEHGSDVSASEDDEQSADDDDDVDEEDAGVPLPTVEPQHDTDVNVTAISEILDDAGGDTPVVNPEDTRPHPRPFESLREFFTRTSTPWQDIVLEKMRSGDPSISHSIKEVRKFAFDQAETMWWDCREEITALEDEQEAAGIGDIVSIADRSHDAGAGARRR